MLSVDEPRVEQSRSKRRKRRRSGGGPMGKELSLEQKAIVKMYVTRGANEGVVTCCYCNKEISSRNVDRWASHLRGCLKTPDDIKAQIRPARGVSEAAEATANGASASVPVVVEPTKLETQTLSAAVLAAPPAEVVAIAAPTSVSMITPSPQLSSALQSLGSSFNEVFKVHVSKDYMKFNAAHFIAYKGFREKLHGHNYRLAVTITGQVGKDGYVVDFGEIKKISRVICNELNESFLVPMNSDALKISFDGTNVHIVTEDMAQFSFPKSDCSLLPIVHSSAEELAIYISNQLVDAFTLVALLERGVSKIEVSISEANQQFASYERTILA